MLKKIAVPAALAGTIAVGAAAQFGSADPANAGAGSGESTTLTASRAAAADSQTAKVTKAANAFLRTLSASQRRSVQYAFSSAKKKSGWSNLPTSLVARNGLAIDDLSTTQVAALRKLLKAALSTSGYSEEEALRKADDYLADLQSTGSQSSTTASRSQAPGGLQYGDGMYYIAVFGTPSTSKRWTLQFGGHHLAINLTYAGATISGTPYFVGAEPLSFVVAKKTYTPMADESNGMVALFSSLSADQLAAAKLSKTFDDVLLGPGQDGKFPSREGQSVAELSDAQRALLTKAITAWVGDVDATTAKELLAAYAAGYDETKIAWSSSIDPSEKGAYFRIDGPRVWIEIVTQNGIVTSNVHYHSIWRDRTSDYGAAS